MSKRELKQIKAQTQRRSGRGTHGSLTKAGKVRDQVWQDRGLGSFANRQKYWEDKKKKSRKLSPRLNNRRKYYNRFLRPKYAR